MTAAATSVIFEFNGLSHEPQRTQRIRRESVVYIRGHDKRSLEPGRGFPLRILRVLCGSRFQALFPPRPTQSRANCHATRPERKPRSSAHRRAAARDSSEGFPPSVLTQWSAISRYWSWSKG